MFMRTSASVHRVDTDSIIQIRAIVLYLSKLKDQSSLYVLSLNDKICFLNLSFVCFQLSDFSLAKLSSSFTFSLFDLEKCTKIYKHQVLVQLLRENTQWCPPTHCTRQIISML